MIYAYPKQRYDVPIVGHRDIELMAAHPDSLLDLEISSINTYDHPEPHKITAVFTGERSLRIHNYSNHMLSIFPHEYIVALEVPEVTKWKTATVVAEADIVNEPWYRAPSIGELLLPNSINKKLDDAGYRTTDDILADWRGVKAIKGVGRKAVERIHNAIIEYQAKDAEKGS